MSGLNLENVMPQKFQVDAKARLVMFGMIAVGGLALAGGFAVDHERAWHSYLTSFFFVSSLAMSGLFFTAIQHVAGAGWSTNIRRFAEALASFVPFIFVFGLPIVFLAKSDLYLWLNVAEVAKDPILTGKAAYLNQGFFAVRFVLFTGLWFLFGRKIVGFSLSQDVDGKDQWTTVAVKWSVAFLLIFSLSFSLFAVDFLMSLEPHWFSTIYGIYCFAGMFQAGLALLCLMSLFIIKMGWSNGLVTIEHVHDLAKFTKGFTVFWAYIAFSQFMLIWYANLPEETIFYLNRSNAGWLYISVALLVFRFVVPFLALLPRWAKRTPGHLAAVCTLILAMHFIDIYWLTYPAYRTEYVAFSWMEVGGLVFFVGIFAFVVTRFMSKHNLIAIKDPRKHESNAHHVIY